MALRVFVLAVLVFAGAFGTHEVMHLLVIYAVGGSGSIIVRPWKLGLVDLTIQSLHAQPAQPLDLVRQLLVNFLGPVLAAVPLVALWAAVRGTAARYALWANVLILFFYAVIEAGDLLLEEWANVDVSLLTTPEFNYGVPLLIIVAASVLASRAKR